MTSPSPTAGALSTSVLVGTRQRGLPSLSSAMMSPLSVTTAVVLASEPTPAASGVSSSVFQTTAPVASTKRSTVPLPPAAMTSGPMMAGEKK